VHHCWGCCHHDPHKNLCNLRNVEIASSRWTTCRNRNQANGEIDGPIFAIVCEVKNGAGYYADIPYFDNCRVDTVQEEGGDTVVRFTNTAGELHEFPNIAEYLEFYRRSGSNL
jgi:hypothetical protein